MKLSERALRGGRPTASDTKQIDAHIRRAIDGISIPIMQIGKVWLVGRASVLGGDDVEATARKVRELLDKVT
jgi:hypothetical protein